MTRGRRAFCVACHKPKPIVRRGRCMLCLRRLERAENIVARQTYDSEWRKLSARLLAEHRLQHGNWCPDPNCENPHTSDLCVDHVKPRSLEAGTRVLCRACNTRAYQRQRRGGT